MIGRRINEPVSSTTYAIEPWKEDFADSTRKSAERREHY
jgi:hypothetical protein